MGHVVLAGGTGFIGRELGTAFARQGWSVTVLTRRPEAVAGQLPFPARLIAWNNDGSVPAGALDGADAVINLSGAGIADRAWTSSRRADLLSSRLQPCEALIDAVLAAKNGPAVMVQASAIGFYGDRGDETLTEASPAGSGFLADICRTWEAPLARLAAAGKREVRMRIGLVLGHGGGALPKLLKVYAMGFGASLGSGRQWVSWIHIDDLVALFVAAVLDQRYQGAVNAVAPAPVPFSLLHRLLAPGVVALAKRVPKPLVRVVMGARSALVVQSQRVLPEAAKAMGFRFVYRELSEAAKDLWLGRASVQVRLLVARQWVPAPIDEVFGFFSEAKNLEALTPAFLHFHVASMSTAAIEEGTEIAYRLRLHGVPLGWRSRISHWRPPTSFVDEQLTGPYALWHHEHLFERLAGGTLITDRVHFKLPAGVLGAFGGSLLVDRDLEQIFGFRQQAIAARFPAH